MGKSSVCLNMEQGILLYFSKLSARAAPWIPKFSRKKKPTKSTLFSRKKQKEAETYFGWALQYFPLLVKHCLVSRASISFYSQREVRINPHII